MGVGKRGHRGGRWRLLGWPAWGMRGAVSGDPGGRTDSEWHHVAVSWEWESGATRLYYDGEEVKPFWSSKGGYIQSADPKQGGVDPHMAAQSQRLDTGTPPPPPPRPPVPQVSPPLPFRAPFLLHTFCFRSPFSFYSSLYISSGS